MTITYQSAGTAAYTTTTFTVAHPASVVAGDLLVLVIGQKPSTANSGGVDTPAGWMAITSLTGAGGYGATLGADTGNTNIYGYYKVATGTESGTNLSITTTNHNVGFAQIYRLSTDGIGWEVVGTTGSDTSAGSVSVTFSSNPGVTSGDYVIAAMCIPTDVTTPSQFSAEALSATGATFGTVTEVGEFDTATGNQVGGFTARAAVTAGTASAAPVMTATAGGTTTNVRGPAIFIRIRDVPVPPAANAPVVAASSSGSTSVGATQISTAFPSGVSTGDLLILLVARINAMTMSWPAGWTSLVSNTANDGAFETRYRIYQAGDSAPVITGTSSAYAYRMLRVTGHDLNTAPEASAIVTGSSTTPNPSALNPTNWDAEDTLWIAAQSNGGSTAPSQYPVGYGGNLANAGMFGPALALATRARNIASEDPGTFTIGSQPWGAATIAVRPVPLVSAAKLGGFLPFFT